MIIFQGTGNILAEISVKLLLRQSAITGADRWYDDTVDFSMAIEPRKDIVKCATDILTNTSGNVTVNILTVALMT